MVQLNVENLYVGLKKLENLLIINGCTNINGCTMLYHLPASTGPQDLGRDQGPDGAAGGLGRSTPRQADDATTQPSGAGRRVSPTTGTRSHRPCGNRTAQDINQPWPPSAASAASPSVVVSKSLLCSAHSFFRLPLSYKLFLAFFSYGRQPRKF